MSASASSDKSLTHFCEGIRQEVEADRQLMKRATSFFSPNGDAIKTASLGEEMDRRRLSQSRIVWL
jgi:hypothetical protein